MAFDADLLTELNTDPVSMGYTGAGWKAAGAMTSAQYQAVADLLNDPTQRTKDRTDVPGYEIYAAITPAHALQVYDLATGTPAHQRWLDLMFQLDSVPLDSTNIRTALTTIFAGKQSTLDAIAALQTVSISRSEEQGWHPVKVGDLMRVKGAV